MSTESPEPTDPIEQTDQALTGVLDEPATDVPAPNGAAADPAAALAQIPLQATGEPADRRRARHAAKLVTRGRPEAARAHRPATIAPMADLPRRSLGIGLAVLSALLIAHLLWAWSFAAKLVGLESGHPRPVRVHWLWLSFSPTVDWALLLVVTLAAAAGSTAHTALIFANRTGHAKLESTWAFWYVLRPGASAIIGVLTYIILKAGFLGSVNDGDGKGLAFAAAVGALSGMFTDTLMAKLRGALGASPFTVPASDPAAARKTGGVDPVD